ncbi:hypothetical protein ACFPL7_09230 [Dongia soli]|uniref:Uncharacterized protein n=1 Tax=Dongia soli TaxID=600628 RepID=A0ABU5EC62_9PROT|nr:hypothetical protein [Dongia soli]MDY0883130.1 hypothetical protein [Dongia soli]
MEYKVFIQTNDEQYLGALVAAHALKRNSKHADKFDVEIMHYKDFPWLEAKVGQKFLRGRERRVWKHDDLQSFTPLRFAPPKLMNYQGRAVVIDPDCFAVADIWDLLTRDMQGKALMCRIRPALKDLAEYRASSVMLLDNTKLHHWDAEKTFNELFEFKKDYMKWVKLEYEPDDTVGTLEDEWNDFDRLTPQTKILHNTYRRTQPWKTGLPIDFTVRAKAKSFPASVVKSVKRWFNGGKPKIYRPHPDPKQEQLFFDFLSECLEQGIVTEEMLQREMASNHIRHDALQLCHRQAA